MVGDARALHLTQLVLPSGEIAFVRLFALHNVCFAICTLSVLPDLPEQVALRLCSRLFPF